MKKKIIFIICLFLFANFIFAEKLQSYFNIRTFKTLESPYLESYLSVIGNSAVFAKKENGKYQAVLEVTIIFKENGIIKNFKKYQLTSPEIKNKNSYKPNFIDVQRFVLENGIYNYELKIIDINAEKSEINYKNILNLDYRSNLVQFSDIQLIESFSKTKKENILSKNSYDLIPYISDFYPENINKLIFYSEIYNTDKYLAKDESFLIRYFIEKSDKEIILNKYVSFFKKKSASIIPVFSEFNIENLPSGNYNLVIEARNRKNELLKSKKFTFQRSNVKKDNLIFEASKENLNSSFVAQINDAEILKENIKSLYPISSEIEKNYANNIIKINNFEKMQNYFYVFWYKRDEKNYEKLWKNYKKRVDFVNNSYSTQVKKGYYTDRGRIYLQYGSPNSVIESKHEPSSYPYEIWHYYRLEDQTNKRFVFYNQFIVGDEYTLIHSNAKGEFSNRNWEVILQNRNEMRTDHDRTNAKDHYGSQARKNFLK